MQPDNHNLVPFAPGDLAAYRRLARDRTAGRELLAAAVLRLCDAAAALMPVAFSPPAGPVTIPFPSARDLREDQATGS
jgi:hypothetical protein